MSISNNLYPPIINTYMPSFIYKEACRVYFSLSNFNKYEQVANNVQITVNDKNTNQSVLNSTTYPAGIKITTLQEDPTVSGHMKYYVEILPSDLRDGEFKINRYYKVQIRFTSDAVEPFDPSKDKISQWLSLNSSMFSEWSSVCLIRGIKRPILTVRGFENNETNTETFLTSESIDFVGNLEFDNPDGEMIEYLESATVQIYKTNDIEHASEAYTMSIQPGMTSAKSEFQYTFKEVLEDGASYTIKFTYRTNGGYQETKTYTFKVIQYGIDKLNANIFATPEDEEGRIKIEIKALTTIKEDFIGKITIRRASSETNFSQWEDVHNALLTESKQIDYTWYDYTIKSGVLYRYCVQKRNRRNDRGVVVKTEEPVMAYFEDVFLTQGGRQLKLKFDSTIGSFKYTILESKMDTLGSKYPFIYRNGNTKYRTFPISGLITSFCDEAGLFTTKEKIYGNSLSLYERYNNKNDINEYRDFSYEREFREKVMEFLYENNIKLFKSPTEGNMLIKLMDINLTPNQQLGRMLYSFTATAYEMDEATIENYHNYNIQTIDTLTEGLINQTEDRLGKISIAGSYNKYSKYFNIYDQTSGSLEKVYCTTENIIQLIHELSINKGAIGFDNTINKLKQVKITFTSEPVLIKDYNGTLSTMTANSVIEEGAIVILGYWIKVNGQDVIIRSIPQYSKNREFGSKYAPKENGFASLDREYYANYELYDLEIYSLENKSGANMDIIYIAEYTQTESETNLVNTIYYNKYIGQFDNLFNFGHSIGADLHIKYDEEFDNGYQELLSINGLSVEADPGTLIYIKDSLDKRYNAHEISSTGYLDFNNTTTTIDDLYFNGVRLVKAPYQENYPDLNKDRTDFVYKYPYLNDNKYHRINNLEYVIQYYKHSIINTKLVVEKVYVNELPDNPVKNGVYLQSILLDEANKTYAYKYWIYYNDSWYEFDPAEEVVHCPVWAIVNYYCEVAKGEYGE